MADQVEVIQIEVDPASAAAGAKVANAGLELVEKTAGRVSESATRAVESESRRIVTITDRSRSSIERLVAAAERKASFAGKSGADRLLAERDLLIKRIEGDERAVERVRAAYERLGKAQDSARPSRFADAIRNPLQAAGNAVDSFTAKFGTAGVVITSVGAALAVAGKFAFDLVAGQGKAAEEAINLSERLGTTGTQAERLSAMAGIAGVNVGSFETAMRTLSQALADGSEEGKRGAEALAKLGIQAFNSRGNLRPVVDIFRDISSAISRIDNQAERVSALTKIFGRGALELLPLLRNFDELEKAVIRAGTGMDENLVKSLARADDKIDEVRLAWKNLREVMAGKIVGGIEVLVSFLSPLTESGGAGVSRGIAARGRGLANRAPEILPPNLIPDAEQSLANAKLELELSRQGNVLIERFKANRKESLESLRAELVEIRKQRDAADAKLIPGLEPSIARQRIDDLQVLITAEGKLEARIKARTEAEQKAEAQRRLAEKGQAEMARIVSGGPRKVELIKEVADRSNEAREFQAKRLNDALAFDRETLQLAAENARERLSIEERVLEQRHDSELQNLEAINARTVDQKIAVEQKRAAIEEKFLLESFALKARSLERELGLELDTMETIARARGETEEAIAARRDALIDASGERARRLEMDTEAAIIRTRQDASIKSGQFIEAENQRRFDSIKRSADGLFDSLLEGGASFGRALSNILKVALLTPIKEFSSNLIAALLTGQRVAGGGGSSRIGGLAGLFGGFGGFPGFGGANAPGGTGTFTGAPVGGLGGGGWFGGFGNLAAGRGILSQLGNIGFGAKGGDFGGEVAGSFRGVGGAAGGAMLLGGGALAAIGLQRGGLSGLGMTTAGGALIGAKFGGPLGALIGGGIGAIAGTIRLFIKGAADKIVEKVKAVYGISISKSFAQDPLLGIIKQQFGGNIDVGIRSPAVRDLIELYGMSTGAANGPLGPRMTPLTLTQSGGVISQVPSFFNGSPLPSTPAVSAPSNVTVVLDPDATRDFWETQTLRGIGTQQGQRAVQSASVSAARGNFRRRESAAQGLTPSLVTS